MILQQDLSTAMLDKPVDKPHVQCSKRCNCKVRSGDEHFFTAALQGAL
jgi:hypothetical protein